MARSIAMWAMLVAIPIIALLALVLGFYAAAKLTYSAYVCRSFARIDGEIGWILEPSATSCLGGRSVFSNGPPWFESSVYTDANGFRSARSGTDAPIGGVMFVGDSFTFGYGVNFDQSFPGMFAEISGIPVVDIASPAYSTPQFLLLAERWIDRLRPRAIVVLEIDQWRRAACRGRTRPTAILKPCYWQSPSGDVEIVTPPPGRVERWAASGVVPGGMIGAGEITWSYFLWSRPILQVVNLAARFGVISGFAHDYAAVGVDEEALRLASVRHIGRLAEKTQVPIILLNPIDSAPGRLIDLLPPHVRALIHRVGKSQWDDEVVGKLPADRRTLPHDDHFSAATNRLVSELVLRECRKLGLIK
jgi:hypothetical protein